MNMIKTVTVASVLAAASIAQADVLFDSLSTFDTSETRVIESQVVGMTILTQDSLRGSDFYNLFNFTGAGDLSFVLSDTPGSTADFAMYANDKIYSIDGRSYWGPGYRLAGTEFEFDTYVDGHAGKVSTTDFKTFDSPVAYHDRNWAGVSVIVSSADTVTMPLSQLASGYNSIAPGLDINKDYWIGTDANFDSWPSTLGLGTYGDPENYKPFSFTVEGTVTTVPEASTMQLALMGLAALGGYAGLRRFKRN
ncbi:MAG: PEP-CTERM sorting domain-containing protein [Verrucomicrobia bacterium]|nr:PEP-CTERM sorting domain-containing protein [Verrucomicrobiota bacterium]